MHTLWMILVSSFKLIVHVFIIIIIIIIIIINIIIIIIIIIVVVIIITIVIVIFVIIIITSQVIEHLYKIMMIKINSDKQIQDFMVAVPWQNRTITFPGYTRKQVVECSEHFLIFMINKIENVPFVIYVWNVSIFGCQSKST